MCECLSESSYLHQHHASMMGSNQDAFLWDSSQISEETRGRVKYITVQVGTWMVW